MQNGTDRFAGAEMGHSGNNGSDNVAAAIARDERIAVPPSTAGTFRGGGQAGTRYADFSGGLEALNSYYQGSRAGTYTVQGGESLQQVAAHIYGDANLWYKIAEANGLSGSSALVTGQTLRLPAGVVRSSHNAGTFKPYDPGQTIGELSPTTPKPKKGNNCGVVGQILLAVVAIAVAVVLPKAIPAIAKLGAFGAGAASAAVSSIVSQGVGVATGIQDKFSFKGVALAALSGGIGASLKGVEAFGKVGAKAQGSLKAIANAAVRGALGSAITQGVATATGLQDKFSWAGVAAAGVAGGIGQGLGGGLAPLEGKGLSAENIAAHTAVGAASLLASAATRSAINGDSFSRNIAAGLPDVIGQVVGRAIGGAVGGGARPAPATGEPHEIAALAGGNTPISLPSIGIEPSVSEGLTQGELLASRVVDPVLGSRIASVLSVADGPSVSGLLNEVRVIDGGPASAAQEIATSGFYVDRVAYDERVQAEYNAIFYSSLSLDEKTDRVRALQAENGSYRSVDFAEMRAFLADAKVPGTLTYEVRREASLTESVAGLIASNPLGAGFIAYSGGADIAELTGLGVNVAAIKATNGTAFAVGETTGTILDLAGLAGIARGGISLAFRNADEIGRSADEILVNFNVTDANLRQQILDAGFDPTILSDASPITLTRFDKLFQGTLDANKAFRGRLGNLSTRARTIETAVDIDRAGLTPAFERQIHLSSGRSRFVDVSAFDPATLRDIKFYQLYRSGPSDSIPVREVNAARDILKATRIDPIMIKTGP